MQLKSEKKLFPWTMFHSFTLEKRNILIQTGCWKMDGSTNVPKSWPKRQRQ